MTTRIFSSAIRGALSLAVAAVCGVSAHGENRPGHFTDPETGIIYRQVTRTVERPVVETRMETREHTVYRPQTVKETRPETKTYYTPVTEYELKPHLQGRWNPFRQPTIAYKQVAKTHWEARNQTVNRTQTRTEWVEEKRKVEVPHRVVRMQREQKVDYEVIGRAGSQPAAPNSPSSAFASRLKPLDSSTPIVPMNRVAAVPPTSATVGSPPITSSTLGKMTSDPPRRSTSQGGMRTTELYPSAPTGYGRALPPVNSGMATLPGFSLWR